MNTSIITILIKEIICTGLIIFGLVWCILTVKNINSKVQSLNNQLKIYFPIVKDILKLTHEYIEMAKKEFKQKIEASGNLLGEFVVYYIVHKFFRKNYEQFNAGFSIVKLFWG